MFCQFLLELKCLRGSPLQREALDAEALEEDTVGAEKEAALVGDVREGRRRSLMGAGPLLGQLHFLPSVEADRREKQDTKARQDRFICIAQFTVLKRLPLE